MDKPISPAEISLLLYQNIPMRDGINLAANIFKPQVVETPLPAIMLLTPYGSDRNVERGMYFARRGYGFVSVECRGRGNSEGLFTPFVNEGQDGYDAVEWIARQTWCNGRVGMMGGSYKGMVQWLTAKENPPHLTSMAPTATVCPGIDATRDNNIYRTFNLQVLSFVSGRSANGNLLFSDYTRAKIRHYYESGSAYADLLQGNLETPDNHMHEVFQEWIAHPTFDSFWKEILPVPADYARMDLPVLSITGHFDVDQPGHMHYYREFQKYATEEAKSKHYFVTGPWDHGGTRQPVSELGGLSFGETAVVDMLDLHRRWFDWTLKDGAKPDFLKDNVLHFQMGSNTWRANHTLADMHKETFVTYLSSDGRKPDDVFHSGKLQEQPANDEAPHTVVYDPAQLADKDRYITANLWDDYLVAQDYLGETGWLYYHSAPLLEEVDVAGYITLNAYFEIDTLDTDFYYKLYEIGAEGDNIFLAHGLMRARFRDSLESEELVDPGSINRYEMTSLYMFSRRLRKGSRLRLLVGYLDGSAYQKNFNSGKDVSLESAVDARTCTIKLHCSADYPSSLEIPVLFV
jgi:putative CocE/NonD family hydrolase